jgi:indole-3-glycerol phosphate synthase
LRAHGLDAMLVGESCMLRDDPGEAVRELLGKAG